MLPIKIRPNRDFSASLVDVKPPSSVVVLCESWPSILEPLQGLHIPVESAYFPSTYHHIFKSNSDLMWHSPSEFRNTEYYGAVITYISGSINFIDKYWDSVQNNKRVLVCVEF